jgi:glycosyltransferase involved in cell wall biosynthesis
MQSEMFSIVTPSYNQCEFLKKNIESVANQNYPHFEHIIVDGGSTDQSVNILKQYQHLKWTSEPDRGQSHAINKGFRAATGNIIGWLNSDDVYMPGTFAKVDRIFKANLDVDFIFSHCLRIDAQDRILSMAQGKDPDIYKVLDYPNYIPQPTVFFKKEVFSRTGYLAEEYQYVMDFDFWRRIAKNHKMMLVNDIFAAFRMHGESKTGRYEKRFKHESKISFFKNGGRVWSPYYYEKFIKPKLMALFVYNPIIKRLFFKKAPIR